MRRSRGGGRAARCRNRVNLLPLTAAHVGAATGGRILRGSEDAPIGAISIDSRALQPGDFFVAIRGERFDGHTFVADAVAKGASGVMVQDAASVPESSPALVIVVGDTTTGLQQVARDVRRVRGNGRRVLHHHAGGALRHRVAHERVAVEPLSPDGDEEVPRLQRPAVDRDRPDRRVRVPADDAAPGCGPDVCGCERQKVHPVTTPDCPSAAARAPRARPPRRRTAARARR